jgi:sRNA-binding carbon storage regulator CsrA
MLFLQRNVGEQLILGTVNTVFMELTPEDVKCLEEIIYPAHHASVVQKIIKAYRSRGTIKIISRRKKLDVGIDAPKTLKILRSEVEAR